MEDEEDEEEEEDEDEADSAEPWTIGQGEMVHTSPDNVDTNGTTEPIVLPVQSQEM